MPEKESPAPPSMLVRFDGPDGRVRLRRVLEETPLFAGIVALEAIIEGATVLECTAGTTIIEQGGSDSDMFMIVSGAVDVVVNGRVVAGRKVGDHFGEMGMMDCTSRRTASVVAAQPAVVLRWDEQKFVQIAGDNPVIWRRIGVELARRLAERNRFVAQPRSEPVLFVGCSTEALEVGREIQRSLQYDPMVVELWTDGVFNPTHSTIEDLEAKIGNVDFGCLVVTGDDKLITRDETHSVPRDNVVFELGLLIGALGRERVAMISPRSADIKLPTDLLGIHPITYVPGDHLAARLGPACTELRKIVQQKGPL